MTMTLAVRIVFVISLLFHGARTAQALSYKQAEDFLREFMPLRDQEDLSEDFLSNNIQAALSSQLGHSWSKDVPDEIFLDYVLPYARSALPGLTL